MKRRILFAVEILVLVLFVAGLFLYGQLSSKLDKINNPVMNTDNIEVNEEVQEAIDAGTSEIANYTTYALFGIDHRDKNAALGGENSDTIIIAAVDNSTKEVKLVSVYRDTFLNIGNDTYSKANAAYAAGEAEQAISMLNTNLDLNISEYATVNFSSLATIIDDLGGMDMEMSYAEIVHMNNYCVETSEETGLDYEPIPLPEKPEDEEKIQYVYHLNGVQVTSYCRIRYTASLDMGRTERQRKVIQLISQKAKTAGLTRIFNVLDDVLPMVTTSMTKTEILQILPTLMGYSVSYTTGFPSSYKFSNIKGSVIVPTDLESNVIELHKFLYEDEDYTPSSTVIEYSKAIDEKVATLESGGTVDNVIIQEDTDTDVNEVYYTDPSAYDTTDNSTDYSGDTDNSGSTDYDYSGDDGSDGTDGGTDYDNGGSTDTGGDTGGSDYSDGGSDYDDGGSDTGGDTGGSDIVDGGDDGGDISFDDTEEYMESSDTASDAA